jgi:hypothetical protein
MKTAAAAVSDGASRQWCAVVLWCCTLLCGCCGLWVLDRLMEWLAVFSAAGNTQRNSGMSGLGPFVFLGFIVPAIGSSFVIQDLAYMKTKTTQKSIVGMSQAFPSFRYSHLRQHLASFDGTDTVNDTSFRVSEYWERLGNPKLSSHQ